MTSALMTSIDQSDECACLVEIYRALNGEEWFRNDNWCSKRPLSEWYGVKLNVDGKVSKLQLDSNNVSGPQNYIQIEIYVLL